MGTSGPEGKWENQAVRGGMAHRSQGQMKKLQGREDLFWCRSKLAVLPALLLCGGLTEIVTFSPESLVFLLAKLMKMGAQKGISGQILRNIPRVAGAAGRLP